MKKHQMKYVLTGAIILFAYIFLVMYPDAAGLPADSADTLITLFPGVFVVIVSIYALQESKGMGRIPCMIGIGLGLCYFINSADTLGLVSAELLSGLTVGELQIWIMGLSTIFGGIAYAYSR